jgi:hypothetical protein
MATLAKLMRRDPRMVERKKTGLAKSRKRVCLYHCNFTVMDVYSLCHSIPGSSVRCIYRVLVYFKSLNFKPPALGSNILQLM